VPGRLNFWLLILATVCALSLWLGKDIVNPLRARLPAGDTPSAEPGDFALDDHEKSVHLKVLNGTTTPGLARQISLLLGRAGCVADQVGNAPRRDCERSFLVNRRLTAGRAGELARRLGGVPVIREWDARTAEDAVLVLGADHAQVTSSLAAAAAGGAQ
jgi:hypothetical protein